MVPFLKTEAKQLASETSSFIKILDGERTPKKENFISKLQRGFIFCILNLWRYVQPQRYIFE